MVIDVSFLLALIVLNGVFAMSEIAVVSSKKARLQRMASEGRTGAARALALAAEPTRFFSTVQIGITCVGILSGAIGEATLARRLQPVLEGVPLLESQARVLSLILMVMALTYVSLIVGELVPKRLALTAPERIASLVARPMQILATIGRPLVQLLSASTDGVLRLFRVRQTPEPAVSLEEIKVLMQQGTEAGIFEKSEQDMVTNVLDLDERRVGAILTPRSDIVFLEVGQTFEQHRQVLAETPHSIVPICNGGLDHVVGFVRSKDVLAKLIRDQSVDVAGLASPPLFVPRSITLMKLLHHFRQAHLPVALVVSEHGEVEGLVSLTDVVAAIVGDLAETAGEEPSVVRREDGSLLLDGNLSWDHAERAIGAGTLTAEDEAFQTLGGFVMHRLGRVPRTGEVFHHAGLRFEIVDMDGNRVDRVLVSKAPDRPSDP